MKERQTQMNYCSKKMATKAALVVKKSKSL